PAELDPSLTFEAPSVCFYTGLRVTILFRLWGDSSTPVQQSTSSNACHAPRSVIRSASHAFAYSVSRRHRRSARSAGGSPETRRRRSSAFGRSGDRERREHR